MQSYKFTHYELYDVYQKEVRSVLEYAVPVWHSGLTQKQTSEIEAFLVPNIKHMTMRVPILIHSLWNKDDSVFA